MLPKNVCVRLLGYIVGASPPLCVRSIGNTVGASPPCVCPFIGRQSSLDLCMLPTPLFSILNTSEVLLFYGQFNTYLVVLTMVLSLKLKKLDGNFILCRKV